MAQEMLGYNRTLGAFQILVDTPAVEQIFYEAYGRERGFEKLFPTRNSCSRLDSTH